MHPPPLRCTSTAWWNGSTNESSNAMGRLSSGTIPPAPISLKFQDILIELETASISDIRIERTLKRCS